MPNHLPTYTDAQVLAAPPQRLRLMLIEAGIRYCQMAIESWGSKRNEQGMAAIGRCRQVVSELLNGIKPDGSELSRQITSVYLFLFQALVDAQLRRDVGKVGEVIRVLEIERETWNLVCTQSPASESAISPTLEGSASLTQESGVDLSA